MAKRFNRNQVVQHQIAWLGDSTFQLGMAGIQSLEEGKMGGGSTTEIEGLPPPSAGVSASTAKAKGLDNYKQGQFADVIKWLSWAEILLEKVGESAGTMEVSTCRASCYKEVGEYKKAIANYTKQQQKEQQQHRSSVSVQQQQHDRGHRSSVSG